MGIGETGKRFIGGRSTATCRGRDGPCEGPGSGDAIGEKGGNEKGGGGKNWGRFSPRFGSAGERTPRGREAFSADEESGPSDGTSESRATNEPRSRGGGNEIRPARGPPHGARNRGIDKNDFWKKSKMKRTDEIENRCRHVPPGERVREGGRQPPPSDIGDTRSSCHVTTQQSSRPPPLPARPPPPSPAVKFLVDQ
ncbi:hypothetical protein NL676_008146 [Syzygium grande]|nr:hypothetical protein NL676_008146 [Syzygium grande]